MLNPIEKFKVAILHLNRDGNHCDWFEIEDIGSWKVYMVLIS